MAGSMKDIKRRIQSVNNMEHITNAMKLVSASKFRRAKNTFDKTQQYMQYIIESLGDIFKNTSEVPERYLANSREIKRTCYIVVASSRGLCGGFNSNIIKEVNRLIKQDEEDEQASAVIVAVGNRAKEFFAKRGHEICREYMDAPEAITFADVRELTRPVLEMYNRGEIDKVVLVSTRFVNSLSQSVDTATMLPFTEEAMTALTADGASEESENEHKMRKIVEYEPSVGAVFDYLVPKFVEIMVYGAVIESATCEHAARRMAMENATDNAHEMIGVLTLHYNRTRQAAITTEITEIVSGAEALA